MERSETSGLRQRLKQSRAFFFSLIAIAAIWLVTSMSDSRVYREQYCLIIEGIDRARYAVPSIDSVLTVDITSNGFNALRRGLNKNRVIHIDASRQIAASKSEEINLSLNINEYIDIIRNQIDMRGVSSMKPVTAELHLTLSQRCSKAFVPQIENVTFQFAAMKGLYGKPVIIPDTVWLYGSQASLDKIDVLRAEQQTIKDIRTSSKHRVKLEAEWRGCADVYASTESIEIFIPVESYIEKAVTVPVTHTMPNSYKRIQLYPSSVKLNCLVTRREYDDINGTEFVVTISGIADSSKYLTPIVREFPANVRVKSIDPPQIQYIIIK